MVILGAAPDGMKETTLGDFEGASQKDLSIHAIALPLSQAAISGCVRTELPLIPLSEFARPALLLFVQ